MLDYRGSKAKDVAVILLKDQYPISDAERRSRAVR